MKRRGEPAAIGHIGVGAGRPKRGGAAARIASRAPVQTVARVAARVAALAVIVAAVFVVVLLGVAPTGGMSAALPTVANEPFTLYQGLAGSTLVPNDIVDVQPYGGELTASQINVVHSLNPDSKVVRYVDTSEAIDTVTAMIDPRTWSLDYARRLNTDDEWNDIWANHQSWFLKDAAGQYINRPSTNAFEMNPNRAYLMDPGSAGWREFLGDKVAQRLSAGYDGVFLDQCPPTPAGFTAIPAKYAGDYGLWRRDVNGLINYIKGKFPNALVITNSMWQGQHYYANAEPNPIDDNQEDGTEIEGFINGNGMGPTENEANWLKEVTIVKKLSEEGKIVLARTVLSASSVDSPKKLLAYSLATFLLGKSSSKSYFVFLSYKGETGYDGDYLQSVYNLPLGDPVGTYYQKGVAYRRDFTNGKVIVNPNDAGQSYTFIPLAANHYRDQDGNVYDSAHPLTLPAKAGVILTAVAPQPAATRYEQGNTNIVKTGAWGNYNKATASGGSYGRSATAGASATIAFNGTRLDWIAMKGTTTGKADVYLDGALKATIDLYSASPVYNVNVWSTGTLALGNHVVKIVASAGNPAGKYVTLDAVDITGSISIPTTRYEQAETKIVKAGPWADYPKSAASGGSYGRSNAPDATATITFAGTRLDWIAMKGTTTGIADVYLDGAKVATVDLAAVTPVYQVTVWSSGTLAGGVHTVTIQFAPDSPSGKYLTLDAVVVWGTLGG